MDSDVLMPQMGESIAEGTIVRWIKKVGESVDRDEPLFEISTDKVDAEIPSPAAGILSEIRAKEGETVPVNSVVAVIGTGVEPRTPAQSAAAAAVKTAETSKTTVTSTENLAHDRTSPLVRQLAREPNIDLYLAQCSGIGGRITRDDVLAVVERRDKRQEGQDRQDGQGGKER